MESFKPRSEEYIGEIKRQVSKFIKNSKTLDDKSKSELIAEMGSVWNDDRFDGKEFIKDGISYAHSEWMNINWKREELWREIAVKNANVSEAPHITANKVIEEHKFKPMLLGAAGIGLLNAVEQTPPNVIFFPSDLSIEDVKEFFTEWNKFDNKIICVGKAEEKSQLSTIGSRSVSEEELQAKIIELEDTPKLIEPFIPTPSRTERTIPKSKKKPLRLSGLACQSINRNLPKNRNRSKKME